MESSKRISSMKKIARILHTIFTVVFWVFIACSVILLIKMLFGRAESDRLTLVLSFIRMDIDNFDALDKSGITFSFWLETAAVVVLISAYVAFCLHLICKILKPMSEGNPFDGTTGRNTFILGVVMILGGFMMAGLQELIRNLIVTNLAGIRQYTVYHNWGPDSVLFKLTLLLLSYVFRYGEELQQQADETL